MWRSQEGEGNIKNRVSSGLERQNVPCYFDLKKTSKTYVISVNFEKIQEVSYKVAEFLEFWRTICEVSGIMNVCLYTNNGNRCGSRGSNENSTEFLLQLSVADFAECQVREA